MIAVPAVSINNLNQNISLEKLKSEFQTFVPVHATVQGDNRLEVSLKSIPKFFTLQPF
jgi:hypothetical protein